MRKLKISGSITTDPFDILSEQQRFYRGLYTSINKNRQSRTTCSYFCSREIKNRNGLACNPDKTEDHLCSCFQSITLPGIVYVGGYIRSPIPAAQDLRVLVDSHLMLPKHVKVHMTRNVFDSFGIIIV